MRKLTSITVMSALALTITACSTKGPAFHSNAVNTKINVSESIERLELFVRPEGLSLSARDQDAVSAFMQQYARSGEGALFVNMPSNMAPIGADQSRSVLSRAMASVGLSQNALQTGQYYADANAPAPVVVSFKRLSVDPIHCPATSDLTATYSNAPHRGWGCFAQANLAAMVQDPRQHLAPYDMTAPDSARRFTGYTKYVEGENPASDQPERQENKSTQTQE